MWQALYQAFNNFWNPMPELRAAMALPFRERIKQLGEWSYWRANFRWPVMWRRVVVIFVGIQLCNVGYLTVRGFQTVALERQERALQMHWNAPRNKSGTPRSGQRKICRGGKI
mgnify:CR=1 FL=1